MNIFFSHQYICSIRKILVRYDRYSQTPLIVQFSVATIRAVSFLKYPLFSDKLKFQTSYV
ncbi:hypothetical protein BpHYR1_041083 [Brachionus plicatilis]|uniref:Uncharacterized protein n=1 Tax=Brachionus plicatilis TaxID=10195 RepID=A0A3M7QXV1_BRAPC|nr:hypothetical protein BpHYR1_041083 [Brachionus plicatilis]